MALRLIWDGQNPRNVNCCEPVLRVDPETGALLTTGSGGGSSGGLTDAELRATPVPVSIGDQQVSTVPSNFAIITTAADIVLAAGDQLYIQNLDTDALFVKRGTGASSSSFSYGLAGGAVADDMRGGYLAITDFIGTVSFAGTTVRYMAWKR